MTDPLATLLADLEEDAPLARARERLAGGEAPGAIIEDCEAGLVTVGERYREGTYYIAGLRRGCRRRLTPPPGWHVASGGLACVRDGAEATLPSMSNEANKALVRRVIEEIFLAGTFDAVDELVAEDFTPHTWGPMAPGRDGLKSAIVRVSAGLADATMTIDDIVAEGDRVVVRLTAAATQVGTFMGIPATGRRYEIGEIHWFRVRDGQIAEHWHQADFLGMLRQLGAMPGGGGAMAGG